MKEFPLLLLLFLLSVLLAGGAAHNGSAVWSVHVEEEQRVLRGEHLLHVVSPVLYSQNSTRYTTFAVLNQVRRLLRVSPQTRFSTSHKKEQRRKL